MSFFISYAQNFEDVMLWRALKNISSGFYIDVGASDPEEDSVTKSFYDREWHGINIEPIEHYYKLLMFARPRDINLKMAVGSSDGELTLYDIPEIRGWGTSDETFAEQYRQKGFNVRSQVVPVKTLAHICQEYVSGEIHFLKVDVEGFESEVIAGMNFNKWRPWIVVLEAVQPDSQIPNHERWEHKLISQGYIFTYFDGINRYYVSEEHRHLSESFKVPPNIFDQFATNAQFKAICAANEAQKAAQDAFARTDRLEDHARELEKRNQELQLTIRGVISKVIYRIARKFRGK